MNSLFGYVKKYKLLNRFFVCFLLLTVLAMLIPTLIFSSVFTRNLRDKNIDAVETVLAEKCEMVDVVQTHLKYISNQLLLDEDVSRFVQLPTDGNKLEEYYTALRLSSLAASYPYIMSVGVYSFRNGICIDSASLTCDEQSILAHTHDYVQARTIWRNESISVSCLSFVFYSNLVLNGTRQAMAIIINVSPEYFLNFAESLGNITLMDRSSGTVLAGNKSVLEDEDTISYIVGSDTRSGRWFRPKGRDYVIFAVARSSDLCFVSTQSSRDILMEARQMIWTYAATLLLLLACGFIGITFLLKKVCMPITLLAEEMASRYELPETVHTRLDEYAVFRDSLDRYLEEKKENECVSYYSELQKRKDALQALLRWGTEGTDVPKEIITQLNLHGPWYQVFLLKTESNAPQEKREKVAYSLLYGIGNIMEELLNPGYDSKWLVAENNEIAFLLQSEEPVENDIRESVAKMQKAALQWLDLNVSAIIPRAVCDTAQIGAAYQQARQYADYRLLCGMRCVIDESIVRQHKDAAVAYPMEAGQTVIACISNENTEEMQRAVHTFVLQCAKAEYSQFLRYCKQLIIEAYETFKVVNRFAMESTAERIEECSTLDEIEQVMTVFFAAVLQDVEEVRKEHKLGKAERLIDAAREYTVAHYQDPDLALSDVAESLGVSSSYFGKLFKKYTGEAYSAYLNTYRLEEACRLLLETDCPVNEIANRIGFRNDSYFCTLFKKAFSVTPSNYKALYLKNKPK